MAVRMTMPGVVIIVAAVIVRVSVRVLHGSIPLARAW
jgi:hypothetical protein